MRKASKNCRNPKMQKAPINRTVDSSRTFPVLQMFMMRDLNDRPNARPERWVAPYPSYYSYNDRTAGKHIETHRWYRKPVRKSVDEIDKLPPLYPFGRPYSYCPGLRSISSQLASKRRFQRRMDDMNFSVASSCRSRPKI